MNKMPFTENEWKEIESYAFSEEAPDPVFSESYKRKRAALILSAGKKRPKAKISAAMTAIAAAALLIPTAAAAVGIYRSYMEKTAEYEVELHVVETETSSKESEIMSLNIGYVPEGMTYNEDGPFEGKYNYPADPNSEKGITPQFIKITDPEAFHPSVSFSAAQETFTAAGGGEAYIIEREVGWDQLWVFFPDTPYAALLYVNGFENSEIRKIADGLSLTPSDIETAGIWHDTYGETYEYFEDNNNREMSRPNLFSVGETLNMGDIDLTIDSLKLQDNFEGIDTDCIGRHADYSSYLDENGRITGERILMQRGDGKTTLDSEISRENVTRRVIVMELTGKNKTNHEINLLVTPQLFLLSDGKAVSPTEPAQPNCYYIYTAAADLDSDDLYFSFNADSENLDKNSVDLAPNESVKLRFAYIADSDKIDSLYLNMGCLNGEESGSEPVMEIHSNLS